MSEYFISQVYPSDKRSLAEIDTLLKKEGITRDGNLDYICAMRDNDEEIIATGSCFDCTLRCFAVSSEHQGEGLLNEIISHLMEVQYARGNTHLFLYTKVKSAKFFGDLGFYEIARVDGTLVFMENRIFKLPEKPGENKKGRPFRRPGDERQPLYPGASVSGGNSRRCL